MKRESVEQKNDREEVEGIEDPSGDAGGDSELPSRMDRGVRGLRRGNHGRVMPCADEIEWRERIIYAGSFRGAGPSYS
jgi:hypothetical protein